MPDTKPSPALHDVADLQVAELQVVGGLGRGGVDPHSLELLDLEPDYIDEFTLTTDTAATAVEWATVMFERAADRPGRDLIFQTILRMDVGPDQAPGMIAGWRIRSESDSHVLLAAEGSLVDNRLLIRRRPSGVSLTTALHFRRRRGRMIWACISWKHRSVAPGLLRKADAIASAQS